VVSKTLEKVGLSAEADTVKAELVRQANMHTGATGKTTLNAAGDRAFGTFDFWAICKMDGSFAWHRVATYRPRTSGAGGITRLSGCTRP
jgi:ABC-type branched-subunit amino acid transport system substrate-binding protein